MSQYNVQYRAKNCNVGDWRELLEDYYRGHVANGRVPGPPKMSSSDQGSGQWKVNFPSPTTTAGVTYNTGWWYQLYRIDSIGRAIKVGDYQWDGAKVPTSDTLSPGGCITYWARAHNPVGWSENSSSIQVGGSC